jgi:exopolysaccharide biosynthesis polyprenyl glycosylphosphotransferase
MEIDIPGISQGAAVTQGKISAPVLPQALQRAQWPGLVVTLVVVDVLLLLGAFRLASFVRFQANIRVFELDVAERQPFYGVLMLAFVGLWLVAFALLGLYSRQNLLGGTEEYARTLRASTYCVLVVIVAGFLVPEFVVARGWLMLGWLFTFVLVTFGRFVMRRGVYALRRQGWFLAPAVIVGANREGVSLAEQLRGWSNSGLDIVGFVDKKLPVGHLAGQGLPVLGSVEALDQIVRAHRVEEIILASSAVSTHDNLLEVFQRYGVSKQVNLRLSSGLYEIVTTGLTVREFACVPLVGVNKVRLTGLDQLLKLLLDYTLTIPTLVVLAPLFILIGVAIKLDSTGPVFYQRRVMGVNGKQYGAFKFRTMRVDGSQLLSQRPDLRAELALNHKLKEDPRVTRLGRLLRRTSLDELPQLFNVLRREMSLVGPRMIAPDEMAKYSQWGLNLLTVKPGITGLWQVSGRSNISYQQRVQLDMYYIRNWSIWLDLHLLWQTIPAVLKGTGAY